MGLVTSFESGRLRVMSFSDDWELLQRFMRDIRWLLTIACSYSTRSFSHFDTGQIKIYEKYLPYPIHGEVRGYIVYSMCAHVYICFG